MFLVPCSLALLPLFCFVCCVCVSPTDRVASGAKRRSPTSACGSRG